MENTDNINVGGYDEILNISEHAKYDKQTKKYYNSFLDTWGSNVVKPHSGTNYVLFNFETLPLTEIYERYGYAKVGRCHWDSIAWVIKTIYSNVKTYEATNITTKIKNNQGWKFIHLSKSFIERYIGNQQALEPNIEKLTESGLLKVIEFPNRKGGGFEKWFAIEPKVYEGKVKYECIQNPSLIKVLNKDATAKVKQVKETKTKDSTTRRTRKKTAVEIKNDDIRLFVLNSLQQIDIESIKQITLNEQQVFEEHYGNKLNEANAKLKNPFINKNDRIKLSKFAKNTATTYFESLVDFSSRNLKLYACFSNNQPNQNEAVIGLGVPRYNQFGGRLVHGLSSVPRVVRQRLTLGGEELVEIDFKQSQPTILKHLVETNYFEQYGINTDNVKFKQGDFYLNMVEGTDLSRETAKVMYMNVFLGYIQEQSYEYIVKVGGVELLEALLELQKVNIEFDTQKKTSNLAMVLQNVEATILNECLESLMTANIPALPLYDAVLVPKSLVETALQLVKTKVAKYGIQVETKQ